MIASVWLSVGAFYFAGLLVVLLVFGCTGAATKRADEVAHRHVLERNAQRRARCAAYRRNRNQFRDQRENN